MKFNRFLSVLAVTTVVAICSQSAMAQLVWQFDQTDPNNGYTLQEIVDGGGLLVGDKFFDDFDIITTTNVASTVPGMDTVNISGLQELNGNWGISINGGWATSSGQIINSTLSFTVEAGDGFDIIGNRLWMSAFGAEGDGLVQVAETVWDEDPVLNIDNADQIGDKLISFAQGDPLNRVLDSASFDPIHKIWIVKDITVRDDDQNEQNGLAHLSQFHQSFVQVPEPASLVLLGGGLLMVLKRRRNNA